MTKTRIAGALSLALAVALAATPALAVKDGPVEDPIGVIKIPRGAPIMLGGYWTLSGPDAAQGINQMRGAQVAIKDLGGQIMGHPIRLQAEDDACTAEGGQNAATRIAADQRVVLALGPMCSSSATAAAPILWKVGIPSIGTSSTAPHLTAADRPEGFAGFLRTCYSDIDQGAADAGWVYDTLGKHRVATIHDGSPYAEQLVRVFERNFREKGGEITSSEAIAPTDVDMRPVLNRIGSDKPDIIYSPVFVAAAAQIVRQLPQISGLETTAFIGGGALVTGDFLEAAGTNSVGVRFTFPDVSDEALGSAYPRLLAGYKEMFGEDPISAYHPQAYDAMMMAAKAIEKVAKVGEDGALYIGRRALTDALYNTEPFEGTSGPIECDENGQCGKFKFAAYEFVSADSSTFEMGKNPRKIYPPAN